MEDTKRLTRQELREPDQVTTVLDHGFLWANKHPRAIAAVVGAVLLIGVSVAGIVSYKRSTEASAGVALAKVVETAERTVGDTPLLLPGQKPKTTFPDAASRDLAVIADADEMLKGHGSAKAARGARMLKAQALARRGRHKEAAELYATVSGATPVDALGAAATLARASARAADGETDAAVEDLKRLAAAGNPYLPRDLALQSAAEIIDRAGQHEVAAKLYQRIIDESPDSPLVSAARAKVQELSTKKPATAP